MALAGIAGVAVEVGSLGVVVGATKYVVVVKGEVASMAPPLIKHAPRDEAVVRKAERPDMQ